MSASQHDSSWDANDAICTPDYEFAASVVSYMNQSQASGEFQHQVAQQRNVTGGMQDSLCGQVHTCELQNFAVVLTLKSYRLIQEFVLSQNTSNFGGKQKKHCFLMQIEAGKVGGTHTMNPTWYVLRFSTPERVLKVSGDQFVTPLSLSRTVDTYRSGPERIINFLGSPAIEHFWHSNFLILVDPSPPPLVHSTFDFHQLLISVCCSSSNFRLVAKQREGCPQFRVRLPDNFSSLSSIAFVSNDNQQVIAVRSRKNCRPRSAHPEKNKHKKTGFQKETRFCHTHTHPLLPIFGQNCCKWKSFHFW